MSDFLQLAFAGLALGSLYAGGATPDWSGVFPGAGRLVDLPTYPFQRERYWVQPSGPAPREGEATGHGLIGMTVMRFTFQEQGRDSH